MPGVTLCLGVRKSCTLCDYIYISCKVFLEFLFHKDTSRYPLEYSLNNLYGNKVRSAGVAEYTN